MDRLLFRRAAPRCIYWNPGAAPKAPPQAAFFARAAGIAAPPFDFVAVFAIPIRSFMNCP